MEKCGVSTNSLVTALVLKFVRLITEKETFYSSFFQCSFLSMEYTGIIQHLQKEEGLPEFANAHGRATYTSPGTELFSPTSAWLVVRYT